MTLVAGLLCLIFASLAVLHLHWAGGGKWAASAALPKQLDGKPIFKTSLLACVVVAFGLFFFAYICLAHVALVPPLFLAGRTKPALLTMSGIFALRTIGDFKFVGLFRRVQPTDFSRLDRIFYTPLCGSLCGMLAWLAWNP